MKAILLLSAALLGQSPSAPAVRPAPPVTRYVIQTYKIHHEGLTFYVRGYYRPDIQRIVWNENDQFNRQAQAEALISQPTFGFEQDGTASGMVNRPLVASLPAIVVPVVQAQNKRNPKR